MVNPNSSSFKFGEKVDLVLGKAIRYIVIGGVIVFLGGKVGSHANKPSPSNLNQNLHPLIKPLYQRIR